MLEDIFARLFPKKEPLPTGPVEYIVAGLGNPGQEFEGTRHNAGFLALDRLAARHRIKISRIRYKSLTGEGVIAGKKVLLLRPTTYMNLSGQAVQEAMSFHKVSIERVIVLCDDVALDPGRLRIRRKGSSGGQKGLQNIIYLTGSDQFPRVRIGIGAKAHPGMDMKDWVIGRFTKEELALVEPVLESAATAVELILQDKTDEAMNRFNRAEPDKTEEEEREH